MESSYFTREQNVSRNGYPLCEPPTHNGATENRGPIPGFGPGSPLDFKGLGGGCDSRKPRGVSRFGRSLSPAASSFTFRHIVAPTFINACGPAAADYDDYMTDRK